MGDELQITFHGDYIHVRTYGEDNLERHKRDWMEIIKASNEHDCKNVLLEDCMDNPQSSSDVLKLLEYVNLFGLSKDHKLAMVNRKDTQEFDDHKFAAAAAQLEGWQMQCFLNTDDAIHWLVGQR